MSVPETAEEVREQVSVLHTGRWYIAELDEPQLAVQGESRADAVQKMVKRWEEYTSEKSGPVLFSDDDTEYEFEEREIPHPLPDDKSYRDEW